MAAGNGRALMWPRAVQQEARPSLRRGASRRLVLGLIASMVALGPGGPCAAATRYVSPTGRDAGPGTKSKPWAHPGRAAKRLRPGDTLVLASGRYSLRTEEDILSPTSGSREGWVTIKGEAGARPVLAGRNDLPHAIDLSGKRFVRIENIEIRSDGGRRFRDGISATSGPMSHVVLERLKIHHLDEFGVNVGDVDGLEVRDCEIIYCGYGSMGGPVGETTGWRNVLISGCSLSWSGHYYRGGPGPSPYDRPDGLGLEPSDGPIEIVNTRAEHNRGDGLDSKARNTLIRECIVANNSCDGIKLWGSGSKIENCLVYGRGDGVREPTSWSPIVILTDRPNATFELVNSTVDDALGHNYLMHVQYDYPRVPVKLVVRNCIFSGRGQRSPVFLQRGVAYSLEHNLFYTPRSDYVFARGEFEYGRTQLGRLGAGNRYGDPRFIRPAPASASGDYRLRDGSPAIDAATARGAPTRDLAGTARPAGAGVDIGAYER